MTRHRSLLRGAVLVGIAGTALGALGLAFFWERLPGTLRFDEKGFAHGTGTKVYSYPGGAPKVEDKYCAGQLQRSTWRRPDGSVLHRTEWVDGNGIGLYLNEDGTVRCIMTYVQGVADGPATEYAADGTVARVSLYRRGERVESRSPDSLPGSASRPAR